mmetsp:Transcript_9032/g.19093  ORF Transcript_9032/g.19093 Transcript_9032/m.19093 type:complete len:441 (-) Transcript_9032:102-1424(-)
MFSSRNSPRPDSIGANIFNSDGDGNEITQYAETSQKKREFRTSFASEQFWSIDEKTSSSSKCNNDGVNAPVQLLEEQLQQRDKTISQLHQTMEASEKVQSNRIYLLERQLEELVELSASDCAARRGRSVSLSHNPHTFEKNEQGYIAKDHDSHDQEIQGHQEAKIEISALQELLARVIAEKDRLRFKNDNLKLILLERRGSTAACYPSTISESSTIPSSIQELDNVIRHNEHKLMSQINAVGYDGQNLDPDKERCQEQEHRSSGINHMNAEPNKNKFSTPALPEEQHMALYQMSCRNCPTDQSNVKYYRGCCSTTNNNTQALTSVVMHHFSQVCKMVQQQHYENGYESNPEISNSSNDERKNSGSFQSSSLARHLVMEHCQRFFKEEEVLKWCMENVKVEIQRKGILMHDNNDVPSASLREKKKKKQSKNGNKWKKRRER